MMHAHRQRLTEAPDDVWSDLRAVGLAMALIVVACLFASVVPTSAAPRSVPTAIPVDQLALTGAGTDRSSGNPSGLTGAPLVEDRRGPLLAAGGPSLAATQTGYAGWATPSLGANYLAMRLPRGTVVTITGPGGSWTTRTTDYGPSSKIKPSRVADIAVAEWVRVCGLGPVYGLCEVTVAIVGGLPPAPETDVAE